MKKLSIVVTHYNEAEELCKPLFDSIALQRGINFEDIEVIVVNDGDKELPNKFFKGYPFKIIRHAIEQAGVSVARDYGLDISTGDYVMFCDCDDRFINAYGLHLIFQAMEECYDAITSAFIEEHFENGVFRMVRRENDVTFVHGKVYRKKYLTENGLDFNPALTIHEDGYFNAMANIMTENKKYITTPFYSWVWREGSVSNRLDPVFRLRTYGHFIRMRSACCHYLLEHNLLDKLKAHLIQTLLDGYYDFQSMRFLEEDNHDLRVQAEKDFREFYIEWMQFFQGIKVGEIAIYSNAVRQRKDDLVMEHETITDFVKRIKLGVKL